MTWVYVANMLHVWQEEMDGLSIRWSCLPEYCGKKRVFLMIRKRCSRHYALLRILEVVNCKLTVGNAVAVVRRCAAGHDDPLCD
jgi:hypothetical protein